MDRPWRLLYLPLALREEQHTAAAAWLRSTLEPLGVCHIESWSAFDGHDPCELSDFDGIYIGGGNTYRLLQQVRTSGFDRAITRFIREGRPVYGGSAGAILLGSDIDTALLAGDSNDVRLRRLPADWMCFAAGQWCATAERRTWSELTPLLSTVGCERWRCPSEPGSFSIGTGHARRERRRWSRWMTRTSRTITQPAPSPSRADAGLIPHSPRFCARESAVGGVVGR